MVYKTVFGCAQHPITTPHQMDGLNERSGRKKAKLQRCDGRAKERKRIPRLKGTYRYGERHRETFRNRDIRRYIVTWICTQRQRQACKDTQAEDRIS